MGKAARISHGRDLNTTGRVLVCAVGAGILAGSTTDANGSPVKTYVKDLIRVGDWVMPSTGDEFSVTAADLDNWVAQFDRMNANGVKVHVPSGHTNEADANRGYVVGMFREGDTLYGRIELIGADAIAMASRTEVSIYVPPSLKDGKGNVYTSPIEHVALTPIPVVSGQDQFRPIAASRGEAPKQVPVFRLSQEPGMNPHLVSIAKMHGIDPSAYSDDAALHDAIKAKMDTMSGGAEASKAELSAVKASLAASRAELAAMKTPAEPDPLVLSLSRKNRNLEIDGLVNAGKVIPAVAKALKAAWVPDDAGTLKLSLSPAACGLFDATLAAIGQMDHKILGEQTKAQGVALSRTEPGNDGPVRGAEAKTAAASLMGSIGIK